VLLKLRSPGGYSTSNGDRDTYRTSVGKIEGKGQLRGLEFFVMMMMMIIIIIIILYVINSFLML